MGDVELELVAGVHDKTSASVDANEEVDVESLAIHLLHSPVRGERLAGDLERRLTAAARR